MWVPVQGRGGTGLSLTQRDLPGQVPDLMSAWAWLCEEQILLPRTRRLQGDSLLKLC